MSKKILFSNEARQRIKAGIDKCVDVVKVSMGGNGRNVLIYNGATTEIINDGVSIAREVDVKDEVEMAGIQLAKQCANQTNEDAGDGTTTTLVLLQSILNEIITDFETENPRELRDRLIKEANEVLGKVEVKQIETREDIYNLALTSSLNPGVAEIVEDIYWELGKEAHVSIEETSKNVLEKEIVKGMQFETKFAESKFLLVEESQTYEDIDVAVMDIANQEAIQEALGSAVAREKKDLIVIANQFPRPVLMAILAQKDFNIVPIEYKMLKNIDDLKDYIGDKPLDKVIIKGDSTTVIGGKGDVSKKVYGLRDRLEKEESQYEKENIENRIASLLGSIAIIRVGKNTDVERQEAVLKIEDALGTVKGAYEMGYCKGGGLALYGNGKFYNAPYEQLCENAGVKDMIIPENVIDSFKVVKHSLLNALSTATSILTVAAALIKENDES